MTWVGGARRPWSIPALVLTSASFFCSTAPQAYFRPDRGFRAPSRAEAVKVGRRSAREAHSDVSRLRLAAAQRRARLGARHVWEPAGAPHPSSLQATSSRNAGRHHLGMVGDFRSERRAASFRNGGRLRPESADRAHHRPRNQSSCGPMTGVGAKLPTGELIYRKKNRWRDFRARG